MGSRNVGPFLFAQKEPRMQHEAVTSALCSYANKLLTWEFLQEVCNIFDAEKTTFEGLFQQNRSRIDDASHSVTQVAFAMQVASSAQIAPRRKPRPQRKSNPRRKSHTQCWLRL